MEAGHEDDEARGLRRRQVLGGLVTAGALFAVDPPGVAKAQGGPAALESRPVGTAAPQALAADPLADHLADPLDAHAASAISFTPTGQLGATEVQSGLAALDARLASQLLYSPEFLQGHAHLYDEFFGTSVTTGAVGAYGWQVTASGGGLLTAASTPIANSPGYYNLTTGAAAGGVCALGLDQVTLSGHPAFVYESRVQLNVVNSGLQACTWRAGLHTGAGLAPPSGFYFEYSSADTSLHCRTARAGVRSDRDSGKDVVGGRWYRLRIVSDGGGIVTFFIDDDQVAVEDRDSVLPSAAETYGPLFSIYKNLGAASRALRVDYAYLLFAVTR